MGLPLMSYEEWERRTKVVGRPRSKELKAIDEELKRYHQFGGGDALWRLQQALEAWKRSQGPGNAWVRSIRNRKGAISELTAQLAGADSDANLGLAPSFMHAHMENARLGVLYLVSRLRARPDIFNVFLESGVAVVGGVLSYYGGKELDGGLANVQVAEAQLHLNNALVPGSVVLSGAGGQLQNLRLPPDQGQGLLTRIRTMFHDFAKKLLKLLEEKFGSIELPAAAVKNLVNTCAKVFLDTLAAGIVSGVMDLTKGTVNMVDGVIQKVRAWVRERGVIIASGHPEAIVQSIQRAMNLSLLEGIYQAMKGAVNLGLAWATWFQSMWVTIAIACFEFLVKFIWRLVEVLKMNRFFDEAAEWWDQRNGANALHKRPAAFTTWFRKHALNLPAVSVLVHNSGICGDKMVYLSMYDHMLDAQNKYVNEADRFEYLQGKFNKGVAYLDFLKSWGVKYLNKCGYSFYSKDDFVSALLEFATNPDQHAIPTSRLTRFWENVVLPVANA